jgi:hypothetical protein
MNGLTRISVVLFLLLTVTTCNKNDNPLEPEMPSGTTAQVTGTVRFPSTAGIDLKTVVIELGESQSPLDSSKGFKLAGRQGVPGLLWATGPDSIPLLLAAVSRPEGAGTVALDAASTALALVYMHPLVCGGGEQLRYSVCLCGIPGLGGCAIVVRQPAG